MRAEETFADLVTRGLRAPICVTWELTYACNLSCVHCLSASGRRDARELRTDEALALIDALVELGVFYANVGGGEPTLRRDLDDLVAHAAARGLGMRISTNGWGIDARRARRLAVPGVDVQVSLDGADAASNDAVRGAGSFVRARQALALLAEAAPRPPTMSVVVTRRNVGQLDALAALAADLGARLRLTRLRPAGRGLEVWDGLRLGASDQRALHAWLVAHPAVATGDSFFHLSPLGAAIPGLNVCGAGRAVALIDPIGDVYACPFAIAERFRAGSIRTTPLGELWRDSPALRALRQPDAGGACPTCEAFDACRGGCPAAKHFTGLAPGDPDPECVLGRAPAAHATRLAHGSDHTRHTPARSAP